MRTLEGISPIPSMVRGWTAPTWAIMFALGLLVSGGLLLLLLPAYLFVAVGLVVPTALTLIMHPRFSLALSLATGGLSLPTFASKPTEFLTPTGGRPPSSRRV